MAAVDLNRVFLERARKRAASENVALEFIHSDMRDFVRAGAFDGAINLVTSFGYFENQADDLKTLRNVYESLKPRARFVMDMMGKETLARRFGERQWDTAPDGTLVLIEHKVRSGWDWIENRWIVVKGESRRELNFSHRLYSAVELGAVLERAGFKAVEFFGTFAGAPYDQNAERLVAVATK